MTERMTPYVGVSGVVNPAQHRELYRIVEPYLHTTGRDLGIGIKATHKPQYDDTENKYGRLWYPVGDEITGVADETLQQHTLNIAQTYLEPEFIATDPLYPRKFFTKLTDRTEGYLDALQIDMLQYQDDPRGYQPVFREMAITGLMTIVQCHKAAMEKGPMQAVIDLKRLTDGGRVNYVLFDASHGTGKEMDTTHLASFLAHAYNDPDFADFGTNFGIAGGLSDTSVATLLAKILPEFPEVSWDAEGKLHSAKSEGGDGSLDMERTRGYLVHSFKLLEKYV